MELCFADKLLFLMELIILNLNVMILINWVYVFMGLFISDFVPLTGCIFLCLLMKTQSGCGVFLIFRIIYLVHLYLFNRYCSFGKL